MVGVGGDTSVVEGDEGFDLVLVDILECVVSDHLFIPFLLHPIPNPLMTHTLPMLHPQPPARPPQLLPPPLIPRHTKKMYHMIPPQVLDRRLEEHALIIRMRDEKQHRVLLPNRGWVEFPVDQEGSDGDEVEEDQEVLQVEVERGEVFEVLHPRD